MARLFPLRTETPKREGQPRVVDLEGEDADAVFAALSSATAREIYTTLYEEPGTPSDVAEAIDSSIQNVRYHLEKLEDAGLVEVVDTWYSSRGNEMSVYATANGPLIVTSDQSKAAQLKEAISRFIGGVVALAGGSLLVQHAAGRFFSPQATEVTPTGDGAPAGGAEPDYDDGGDGEDAVSEAEEEETADANGEAKDDAAGDDADADGADGGTDDGDASGFSVDEEEDDDGSDAADAESEEEAADADADAADGAEDADAQDGLDAEGDADVTDFDVPIDDPNATGDNVTIVTDASADALDAATTLPPGLLFFLGGLVVLVAVTAYWYWSARRLA